MTLLFKEWFPANAHRRLTYKDIKGLRVGGAIQVLVFNAAIFSNNVIAGKEYSLIDIVMHHLHNMEVFNRTSFETPMQGALVNNVRVKQDFCFDVLDPKIGSWRAPLLGEEIADSTLIGCGGPVFLCENLDFNEKVRVEDDPVLRKRWLAAL